jgi:uncharacterized protein YndB with AHSA1/START domain
MEQFVAGEAEEVYLAITNATLLRRWLCDVATVDPKIGGRFYAAWNNGFYASGEYTLLETDREVGLQWVGRSDPGPTQVLIKLIDQAEGTRVMLEHSGIGSSPAWDVTRQQVEAGWKIALENLASVIGSGEDLRITLRPMLGVITGEYNENVAGELGVPVSDGLRLSSVVDGLGAEAAGLQKDDVLIRMDGAGVTGWNELAAVLQRHRAGDTILVEYYRGAVLMKTDLTLSRRQIPPIPWTIEGLATAVKDSYRDLSAELDQLMDGVTEVEASFRPLPEAWGIKEILAHLIHGERFSGYFIGGIVSNQEQWTDDWEGNLQCQVDATVAAFPTLTSLVDELKHLYVENATLHAALPVELPKHKAAYWYLAYNALQPQYHFQEHAEEIRSLIKAARGQ